MAIEDSNQENEKDMTSVEQDETTPSSENFENVENQTLASDEAEAHAEDGLDVGAEPEDEVAKYKDQLLRAHAEMANIRRRADADVDKAHKYALEKFVKELLPVVDSMEKAIEAFSDAGEADERTTGLKDGVEMTLSLLLTAMDKFGVDQLNPQGEAFDPQFHEAMTMLPQPDAEPNSVLSVLQKGYTLSGRLVRPAMVVVAKG